MSRKILSVILILALCIGITTTALAREPVSTDYFTVSNVVVEFSPDEYTHYIFVRDGALFEVLKTFPTGLMIENIQTLEFGESFFDSDYDDRPVTYRLSGSGSSAVAPVMDVINPDIGDKITLELGKCYSYYYWYVDEENNAVYEWYTYIFVIDEVTAQKIAPVLIATTTASTVLVDGVDTAFDAYLIEGNNYFKLRDLAYVLNGTEKQFNVGWDGENNAISLTSGQAYTAVGGEMAQSTTTGNKTPTPTSSTIYLDGVEISFTAYLIDGNNYFKLRDIMQTFDVFVGWDGETSTITLDTSMGYTDETN